YRDQREDFHRLVAALAGSPVRELGVMFRRHAVTPDAVERILQAEVAPQLEVLDLSVFSATIVPGEPLAATDRLPSLRRLDHGRYHGFEGMVRNPNFPNLLTLGTEWDAETDQILAESPLFPRVRNLHLWGDGRDLPESRVPLANLSIAL